MKKFIEAHPEKHGTYTQSEVAKLSAICDLVKEQLGLTSRDEIDRVAARILVLYEEGANPDRIVRPVVLEMSSEKAKS